jgi:Calcineurin-like phosphoesterase
VVERLAGLATEHAVDAVLVAGDVFDAQTIAERTVRRLFNALQGFAGPWLMIPGNHDAALSESVWTRAQRLGPLPPNLHLALQPRAMPIADGRIVVLAAPLMQRHTYDDLTTWFDHAETPAGSLRIGLAHGSVQGILADEIDSANPIAPDRAAWGRLDCLALGDWHGMKRIDARTWYSGTPEPDRFKGNEPGHALLVDIAEAGAEPVITPLATGHHVWHEWQQTISVASDADALIERLAGLTPRDVVSLVVDGQSDLAGIQRLQSALSATEARARSLQADLRGLRLMPTADDIAALHADGYLGEVIGELRERQAGEEGAIATQALTLLTTLLAERQAPAA